MTNYLIDFISNILFCSYAIASGMLLYQERPKLNKNLLLAIIFFTGSFYLRLYWFSSFYVVFFTFFTYVFFHKLIFKKSINEILFASLIAYTIRILAELFLLEIFEQQAGHIGDVCLYACSDVHIDALVVLISLATVYIFKNIFLKITQNLVKTKSYKKLFVIVIYFNTFLIILFKAKTIEFNNKLVIDVIVLSIVILVLFLDMRQESKINSINDFYEEMFDYSKSNEELLNDYRMAMHENKNKLLIIKSMINEPKALEEYIDELLKENNKPKSFIATELKYITVPGTKNFLNYKLSKMKEMNAQIELVISPDLETANKSILGPKEYNDLYTILGVILDNMIDAIEKEEEKLIAIHMYIDNDEIHAEFANSFSNEVDLSKIYTPGYSTKGSERGAGLSLIKKIVEETPIFDIDTKIVDNFFVQHVTIKLTQQPKSIKNKPFSTKTVLKK